LRSYLFLNVFILTILLTTFLLVPFAHASSPSNIHAIDTQISSGGDGFIAIDSKNYPHIAFTHIETNPFPPNTFYVDYASWNGTAWNVQTVADGASCLDFKLDSHDNPHILYVTQSTQSTFYASWNGSTWDTLTLPSEIKGGGKFALDLAGNPHVAYVVLASNTTKIASWTGTSWTTETVASTDNFNTWSIALDKNDIPHLFGGTDKVDFAPNGTEVETQTLKFATPNNDSTWNIQTILTKFDWVGNFVLDSDGNPHFTYTLNQTLMYASYAGYGWNMKAVASDVDGRGYLALDSQGTPRVSYCNITFSPTQTDLMYGRYTGTNWQFQVVERIYVSDSGPLALDSEDSPHIIYSCRDGNFADLMYATINESILTPVQTPSNQPTSTNQYTPSPSVPEFSVWTALPLLITVAGLLIAFKKSKRVQR
jgi:hypothetical protein